MTKRSLLVKISTYCLLLFTTTLGSSQASRSSSAHPRVERPAFVAHVDESALREGLEIAQDRHQEAVAAAMANYPIDTSLPVATELIANIRWQEYRIEAPGDLPDFAQDLERRVWVTETPLLTQPECQRVIQDAEAHFPTGEWTRLKSGQYEVAGFWIKDVPRVHAWFTETVATKLFPLLVKAYPDFCSSIEDLVVDNAYLFKYTPETGFRTDVHTDSGCLAFTLALNPSDEYSGGGTWFEGLNGAAEGAVIEMNQGQVSLRPGGVKHCGHAVKKGTRYIIGGFCMHKRKVEHVRQLLYTAPDTPESVKRKTYEAAVALNPATDIGYNLLAAVYEAAGEITEAQRVLEYCMQHVHPYSGDVAYALGSIYKEQGQHEKARQCFLTCLQSDAYDFDAMLAVVLMSAALGDAATEEEYCHRILRTEGVTDEVASRAYANLAFLSQGTDDEISLYQKSIALRSEATFAPVYSLASAYANREQWGLAVQYFRQSIPLTADMDDKLKALKHLYRCAISAIRSDPSAAPVINSQAELLERLQNFMGKENYELLSSMMAK